MSTGKTKVVGNRELSRSLHSNSALLYGKGVQFTQASKRPQLVSYVWGCSYGPWRSLPPTQARKGRKAAAAAGAWRCRSAPPRASRPCVLSPSRLKGPLPLHPLARPFPCTRRLGRSCGLLPRRLSSWPASPTRRAQRDPHRFAEDLRGHLPQRRIDADTSGRKRPCLRQAIPRLDSPSYIYLISIVEAGKRHASVRDPQVR